MQSEEENEYESWFTAQVASQRVLGKNMFSNDLLRLELVGTGDLFKCYKIPEAKTKTRQTKINNYTKHKVVNDESLVMVEGIFVKQPHVKYNCDN